MGFFQLDEVFAAYKNGYLKEFCSDMHPNDLAILKHEITGYVAKNKTDFDVEDLLKRLEENVVVTGD